MAWNITAQYIEGCNCNMICPCWFGVKDLAVHDQGWCATIDVFRIQQGNSDGVDLSGRTVVDSWHFPGPTFLDGNGTGRLYVDDAATPEQTRELEAIFQGKKGGPLAALEALIPTWLPTLATKIEIQEEGDTVTATVVGAGQLKSQRLKNEAGQPTTLEHAGFASALEIETLELASSVGSQWSDPQLPHIFEARSGIVANVNWRVS